MVQTNDIRSDYKDVSLSKEKAEIFMLKELQV